MQNITIYHNPRCQKSRQTLNILRDEGIEPTIIEYLKTPPSESQLTNIVNLLKIEAKDLIRTKESTYKQLAIDANTLNDQQLIALMVEHPILIERPIVVNNQQAVVARPPEKVLDILS